MLALHNRVNSKESVVGWYATGTSIDVNSQFIHEYFAGEAGDDAVHLLVDTGMSDGKMDVKSFTG